MSTYTVRQVRSDLKSFVEKQETVIGNFTAEIESISAERKNTAQDLKAAVKALIPTGDMQRYEDLTRAAKEAGATFDCAALATQWTDQDGKNRQEKAELEAQWGTIAEAKIKSDKALAEVEASRQALNENDDTIDAFDQTTREIEAHNKAYPNNQITEEDHDQYESTSLWKRIGYYLFFNRGPHSAYLAIGDYSKQYNVDYYEQARVVKRIKDALAEREEQLKGEEAALEKVNGALNRMNDLEGSYRGPEGIAREIRDLVSDFLASDDDFAVILCDHLKNREAVTAATAVAKIRTLGTLAASLKSPLQNAKNTLDGLTPVEKYLDTAEEKVGNKQVYFDKAGEEASLEAAATVSRDTVKAAKKAREAVDAYVAPEGISFVAMQAELEKLADINAKDNSHAPNFTALQETVKVQVQEYDAEMARIAEERRRAEEAAARIRAAQRAEAERIRRQSQPTVSYGSGRSNTGISPSSPSPASRRSYDTGFRPSAPSITRSFNSGISRSSSGISAPRSSVSSISRGTMGSSRGPRR